ncbi:MAG TPA: hypothetical protein VNX18_20250 [Bryobacteraceae bacterium]|nr:hypothetical protein [Bryobacteraceae bacterium]
MNSVQTSPAPAALAVPQSGLGWLAPSLCDLFFLAVIGWSFMTAGTGWGRLLWDGDTALHMAIGNYVLDHHTVPTSDPFSFTEPNAPWLASEYGTGVVFAALNRSFGLKGVVFVCGVTIAALITVLLRSMLAAGADIFLSIMLALMASNALSLHYHARPHLFTLLFLAVTAWAISTDRVQNRGSIWLLVPLAALWANLHPGFVILLAYLVLVVLGCALEWWTGVGSRSAVVRYAALAGACGLATLVNPFGIGLHFEVLSYLRAHEMTDFLQEFQAPTFRSTPQLYYMAFLLAGLAVAGVLVSRKKFTDALPIFALGYASLISLRHSTVFVIIAAPIIARELSIVWQRWVTHQPKTSSARILDDLSRQRSASLSRTSVWAVAGLAAVFLWSPASSWPAGFDGDNFPVDMAARHAELATSRVFTTEQWADYLLYRNYPWQRNFYDDRSLYGAKMFRPVAALLDGKPGWNDFLDKYNTELVLIESKSTLSKLLSESAAWTLVDRDKTAALFRRVR